MRGLIAAEWLRFRKRRGLQIIVFAVPVLVAVITLLGYNSIYESPPFDEAAFRQEMIDSGSFDGVPPDQIELILADMITSQRQMIEQQIEQAKLSRGAFAFPRSLATSLATGAFMLLGLVLMTATTIGDEFGWGTIRGSLLASTNRRRFLLVRLGAVMAAGVLIVGLLLLVGAFIPLVLNIPADKLPASLPAFDAGALLVMLAGQLIAGAALIGFAATVTLVLRNGALALVAALVWIAIEAAILTLLTRFPEFGGTYANDTYTPGPYAWVLEAFPLRGLTSMLHVTGQAASGLPTYPGEAVSRDLSVVGVPITSFAILAVVLTALAFRRFQRMDIVE